MTPDYDRIQTLIQRLDDLCRQAAEIVEELAAADRRGVVVPGKNSPAKSKFHPTSTDESKN